MRTSLICCAFAGILFFQIASLGCATSRALGRKPWTEVGDASYYNRGRRTASGERFNPRRMTAAHRTLPFGTRVRVTNLENHRTVVVRITDRGPFIRGRIVDLSYAAGRKLGLMTPGVAEVRLHVLSYGKKPD